MIKIPAGYLKSVYLDNTSMSNNETKEEFLDLFESIESINFSRNELIIKGIPNKKYAKLVNSIFKREINKGYYGTEFHAYLKSYKFFMKKFNLKLYESNINGYFSYCLTDKNPNESFLYDKWYFTNTFKLKYVKIKEIILDVNKKFLVYDKSISSFKIKNNESIDLNDVKFCKLDRIYDIINVSSREDKKLIKEFNKKIKEAIEKIFNNSKNKNPAAVIPFYEVSTYGLCKIIEWEYDKTDYPLLESYGSYITVFKDKKVENKKDISADGIGYSNGEYVGSCTISTELSLSNAFFRLFTD